MASIKVRNIRKSFTDSTNNKNDFLEVIGGINLDVTEGEFVAFFGPNGCGKTTFLTILSDLLDADEGTIKIESTKVEKPRVGYIFQNFRESLYPWLRNVDNVAFPLELRGVKKSERKEQARVLLKNLGLDIPLDGYPYQLSGGQQQLLSIARALIFEVDVLLMDEPFASLDYTTRFYIRDLVQNIWMKTKTTTLFVSHNIEEAIYLADRLILFSKKPMRIIEDIPINLPRPREANILEQDSYFRIQSHALRLFKEEMVK